MFFSIYGLCSMVWLDIGRALLRRTFCYFLPKTMLRRVIEYVLTPSNSDVGLIFMIMTHGFTNSLGKLALMYNNKAGRTYTSVAVENVHAKELNKSGLKCVT